MVVVGPGIRSSEPLAVSADRVFSCLVVSCANWVCVVTGVVLYVCWCPLLVLGRGVAVGTSLHVCWWVPGMYDSITGTIGGVGSTWLAL